MRLLEKLDFLSEFLGMRLEHYSVAVVCYNGVMMISFTEVRLFSTIALRNAGYTFAKTEGLVNYLLQDHSIATEKATGFHTTP